MSLLPDTQNRGLRMRRECRERFPHHRLQRKALVSDPVMHHGTCVMHVPWCMSGTPNRVGGGKRSRHSRRLRNSQFYVFGKRPMTSTNAYPLPLSHLRFKLLRSLNQNAIPSFPLCQKMWQTVNLPCTQHGWLLFSYRKTSSISRTKSQNLNVSHLVLWLSLAIPLNPNVKLRMKM